MFVLVCMHVCVCMHTYVCACVRVCVHALVPVCVKEIESNEGKDLTSDTACGFAS